MSTPKKEEQKNNATQQAETTSPFSSKVPASILSEDKKVTERKKLQNLVESLDFSESMFLVMWFKKQYKVNGFNDIVFSNEFSDESESLNAKIVNALYPELEKDKAKAKK